MDAVKLYASQLRAMLVRNITLKYREKRKLLWVSSSIILVAKMHNITAQKELNFFSVRVLALSWNSYLSSRVK